MTNTCLNLIRIHLTDGDREWAIDEIEAALDHLDEGICEIVAWQITDHKLGLVVVGPRADLVEFMHRGGYTSHAELGSRGEDHVVSEYEALERYREFLDETGPVTIGVLEYSVSVALERVDPIAFRVGFNDWCDAEGIYVG